MNKKKVVRVLVAICIFIYFEFFFLGVQIHQHYVGTSLTKEEAAMEYPEIELSATDELWLKQIWDSITGKEYYKGEYSLEDLKVPTHPEYESANVTITVSQGPSYNSVPEYMVISVFLSNTEKAHTTEKVSFGVYSTMAALEKIQYGDFEMSKSIRCYKDSLFSKSLPDIIYTCEYTDAKYVYSKLEMEHEWFALIKQLLMLR